MTSEPPPTPPYFNGISFNSSFYNTSDTLALTETLANSLYLRKKVADIASE